jgi:hypothetical protein
MNTSNGVVRMMVEVKPYSQTIQPKKTKGKREQTFLMEVETYTKNEAKWKAARHYCNERGWLFRIVTEKELFKGKVW